MLVGLLGCTSDAASSAPASLLSTIRAASFNLANGAGYTSPAERARQNVFLASLSADVIGLQEVDVGVARSGGGNTAAQATATMPGTVVFAKCASVNAQGALTVGGTGSVGVALWVRAGLTVVDSWPVALDYADQVDGSDGWPRCALVAIVSGAGRDFVVAVVHLLTGANAYVRERRRLEVQEATAYGVDVLLGDMNALGDEVGADVPASLHLCSKPDSPGCYDQAWAAGTCTGRLVPTHNASDHPYAAIAEVTL